jgi:TonB family protein
LTKSPGSIQQALKISIIAHALIVLGWIVGPLILKTLGIENTKTYIPSLRVDLVALPDRKVTDTHLPDPVLPQKPPEEETAKPEKSATTAPTTASNDSDISLNKSKNKKAESMKADQIKKALARIRALEQIKGNEVSKGSSLSGEVKKELETTYFDALLEKVREHWELPTWLLEKNLIAQASIKIAADGRILKIQLVKSSGNEQFDQEVKRAIQLANPLPPPPSELNTDSFRSNLILGFPL